MDFSAVALDLARSRAENLGADVAERIEWIEGDLATWTPPPEHYDLVTCLYVHIAGSVPEMVRRLASGTAVGGTLLLVGHRPVDPATGKPTPAAGQVQVSVEDGGRRARSRPLGDRRGRGSPAGGRRQRRGRRRARATPPLTLDRFSVRRVCRNLP